MGITFEVGSFTRHPSDRRGPRQLDIANQLRLDLVQREFGLDRIPWEEPVLAGTVKCDCSSSAMPWEHIRAVAQTLDSFHLALSDEVEAMARQLLASTILPYREGIDTVNFSHLLKIDWDTAYWIPIEFEFPRLILADESIGLDYAFSVGSIFRLERELDRLLQILEHVVEQIKTGNHPQKLYVGRWDYSLDVATRMHNCTKEGISRHLPFCVRGG